MRWISSTKRTSPGARFVRIAARSPAFSRTGPDVTRICAPISRAMMCASVVLPRPGGPQRRTWSSGSCRCRAACRKTPSVSFSFGCPMNSKSARGRSVTSGSASAVCSTPERMRSSIRARLSRQGFQGGLEDLVQVVDAHVAHGVLDGLLGLHQLVAEVLERADRVVDGRRLPGPPGRSRFRAEPRELLLQLEAEALGQLLADARDGREHARVLCRDRADEVGQRQAGEHRERDLRPDARDRDQAFEDEFLLRRREAEERERVLADVHVHVDRGLLAGGRKRRERAERDREVVTHAVNVEDEPVRPEIEDGPREAGDHGATLFLRPYSYAFEPPIRDRSSRLNSIFRSERFFWTRACRSLFDFWPRRPSFTASFSFSKAACSNGVTLSTRT